MVSTHVLPTPAKTRSTPLRFGTRRGRTSQGKPLSQRGD
jgi:hypothetical protein